MVLHNTRGLRTGKKQAAKFRKMGFNATVFKRKDGTVKLSVSRPGKNKKR